MKVIKNAISPGTILPFGGGVVPPGFLLCDGSTISRTTYAALFAAIGIAHGSGNGTTTFHLPDYRGRFLRGRDAGAGRDPDRTSRTASNAGGTTGDNVGSVQGGTITSHAHHMFNAGTGTISDNLGSNSYVAKNPNGNLNYFSYCMTYLSGAAPSYGLTNDAGGSESRPQNANVLYMIKV